MKKRSLMIGALASLGTLAFLLTAVLPQDAVAGEPKVSICHIPPGNPDEPQTITVSVRAVAAHLAHGDVQAPCDDLCASANECDDGNACTTDSCDGRLCVNTPIDPSACDDENVCTADSCSPDVGCVNSPRTCDAEEICVSPDLGCTEAGEPVGTITADITRGGNFGAHSAFETQAGNLVADTHAWATDAQIAFMNPNGVRSDLIYVQSAGEGDGVVTMAEAFVVQPFGNILETFPMTGAQIVSALEEQCHPIGSARPFTHLGVSEGFTYDLAKTISGSDCTSVSVSNVKLDGVALSPTATYTVTVNSFLSSGGDGFSTFDTIPESSKVEGGTDLDALVNYLGAFSPVAPPSTDRVNELP